MRVWLVLSRTGLRLRGRPGQRFRSTVGQGSLLSWDRLSQLSLDAGPALSSGYAPVP